MALLIPLCVWFACPTPATTFEVAPEPIVYESVVPEPAGNVEQWRSLVAAHFPPSEVERALCILWAESRGNPGAVNPSSGAAGLWQFIPSTWDNMVYPHLGGLTYDEGGPFDPMLSTQYAVWLQQAEGWTQWSPYKRGLCR